MKMILKLIYRQARRGMVPKCRQQSADKELRWLVGEV